MPPSYVIDIQLILSEIEIFSSYTVTYNVQPYAVPLIMIRFPYPSVIILRNKKFYF